MCDKILFVLLISSPDSIPMKQSKRRQNRPGTMGKAKSLIKPNASETSFFSYTFHSRRNISPLQYHG